MVEAYALISRAEDVASDASDDDRVAVMKFVAAIKGKEGLFQEQVIFSHAQLRKCSNHPPPLLPGLNSRKMFIDSGTEIRC
jgi:hypothetical protein